MKITIESTDQLAWISGVECRIWQGLSESGVPVYCYIPLIAVPPNHDDEAFQRELRETEPRPS